MAKRRHARKKVSWRSKLVIIANVVAVVFLLLSYLAPYVDPATFWPIAFIGIAYFPLLVINFFFVLLWAIKKRKMAFMSLITIFLGYNFFLSHIGFHFSPSTIKTEKDVNTNEPIDQLKVLSYNVHFFRDFKQQKNDPNIKEEAIALIAGVNPDVVCVQEFYSRQKGEHDIAQAFKKDLGLPHAFFYPTAKNNFEAYGLAIFSKYPIVGSGHLPDFEKGVNSVIYVDIDKNEQVVRVYNVHLRSFGFQKEDYDFISGATVNTFENNVLNTRRIGSRMKQAFNSRSSQAKALKAHLEKTETPYLVMGDFNDTPISFAVNHIKKGLKNGFKEKGFGFGKTYNGDFPNFQIDYILSSEEFEFGEFHIIRKKLSDHYPIWATVQWAGE
jgi:endonuclease/exonuclease/phosphatase family metal-dependent hydrolase